MQLKHQALVDLARGIEPLWTSDEELDYLAEAALTARRIVEIGSWHGRSAKVLAAASPGQVYCVDIFVNGSEAAFRRNLARELHGGKVWTFQASSEIAAPWVRAALGWLPLDLIWVDDGHRYEDVRRDIEAYYDLLRPGGVFLGHDYYAGNEVARAVHDLLPCYTLPCGTIWRWQKPMPMPEGLDDCPAVWELCCGLPALPGLCSEPTCPVCGHVECKGHK
jgi:SAM-dependent methyltransferase